MFGTSFIYCHHSSSHLPSYTLVPLAAVSHLSLVVVYCYMEWVAAVTPQTPAELWKFYHTSVSIPW